MFTKETCRRVMFSALLLALTPGCASLSGPTPSAQPPASSAEESDAPNPGSPDADTVEDMACGAFALEADTSVFHLVAEREYTWEPGTTIHVWFMDGKEQNMQTVERVALEWTRYANIDFDFFAPDETPPAGPQLRVSFQHSGYWSLIGSQAALRSHDLPTLNINFRLFQSGPDEINRVVLHEFGHALGLWHEHQNPNADFEWDREYIYDYYARNQGWDRATVDTNIFAHLDPSRAEGSDFDPHSIMLYAFPPEFTRDRLQTTSNHELSATDKREIATLYPGRVKPRKPDEQPEEIDEERIAELDARIGFRFTVAPAQGELQNYSFRVDAPGVVLSEIDHVLYQRQHDTFREFAAGTHYRIGAAAPGFEFAWQGWGWVPVQAIIVWRDGHTTTHRYEDAPAAADAGPDWSAVKASTGFYFVQSPPNADGWSDYAILLSDEGVAEHVHWIEYQRQHDTFPEFVDGRFLRRVARAELFALQWRGYGWVPISARVHYKDGTTETFEITTQPQVIE